VVAQFSKYMEFYVEVRANGQIVCFRNFNYEMHKGEEFKEGMGKYEKWSDGFQNSVKIYCY
jgi:hypothetical protein